MSRFFIYCRKSSEAEDRQILSIDSQVTELKRFAAENKIKIVEVLTEAKSAKAPGVRTVFNSMMNRLYKGVADGVLCWKIDRLARNPVDGGTIIWAMKQRDIQIITPAQTYSHAEDNVVWMYLEFGMAQKYVDDLSRNVKRGLKTKAEMGWYPGPTPAGYLNKTNPDGRKTIVKDPKRFPIIKRCWELMLSGKYNPGEIRSIANTVLGFRTVNGLPMARSTIYNIFRSKFYAGTYEYPGKSGIWHIGCHIPMITEEQFEQVQKLMNRGRKWPKNRKTFAFTGLIQCGVSGHAIIADEKHQLICSSCKFKFAHSSKIQCPKCKTSISEMKKPQRLHYVYYRCSGNTRKQCQEPSIRSDELLKQMDRFLEQARISLPHEHWVQYRIKNSDNKDLMARIRQVLATGKPEEQRRIAMAVFKNMLLQNQRLSVDLHIPFEFNSPLSGDDKTFVLESANQHMS